MTGSKGWQRVIRIISDKVALDHKKQNRIWGSWRGSPFTGLVGGDFQERFTSEKTGLFFAILFSKHG